MSRVIEHFMFKTDFYGPGYEHNLYDVDVADIELSQSKAGGDRYWKLSVRGKEYDVAPISDTMITEAQAKVSAILRDIKTQINNAPTPAQEVGNE